MLDYEATSCILEAHERILELMEGNEVVKLYKIEIT